MAGGDTTNFVCDDTNNCETDLGVQCLSQSLFEQIVDSEHSTCDDDALGERYTVMNESDSQWNAAIYGLATISVLSPSHHCRSCPWGSSGSVSGCTSWLDSHMCFCLETKS